MSFRFATRLTALLLSLLFAGTAAAYQQLLIYRIAGKDILAITLADHVDEDAAAMTLKVVPTGGMSDEILIESDGGLDECKTQLEYIKGAEGAYAEIVIDMNSTTMNGVLVIQCATFYGLFPEGR
eukprot:g2064.t1